MATLHIMYDPHDKISTNIEMNKRFDIKSAVIAVSDVISAEEVGELSQKLAAMLVEQIKRSDD